MANEIRATGLLQINKNNFPQSGNGTVTLNMTGSHYFANNQSIGTSYEAIALSDLANVRYLYICNKSTASVSLAMHSASQSFAVLQPDDFQILPPSGSFTAYQIKSSLVNTDVQIVATEA